MKPKTSPFFYFVIALFFIAILYSLVCGVNDLGLNQPYPYFLPGIFLVLFLGTWLVVNSLSSISAQLRLEDRLNRYKTVTNAVEIGLVIVVLAAAAWVRIIVIQTIPMEPSSDFATYYDVADLLKQGTLKDNAWYCDYIAIFPHVYGYPRILSVVFRLFGTSVAVAKYLNVVFSVATVFLVYLIGRLCGGRIAGCIAMLLSAFWPSQLIYITQVASEYPFSFLLMLCIYLFVLSLKICTADMKHPALGILLHIALGISLAVCASVRPMALIAVITIFLCIFFQKIPILSSKDERKSISLMLLSKGWIRCTIVLVCYLLISNLNTTVIEHTIDRTLASGSTSFGYNLLVGMNTVSNGSWNAEDFQYLFDRYQETGDASEAHSACLDLTIERLKQESPRSIFNLIMKKYHNLWGNDNFGVYWNLNFLYEQGNLTPELEQKLYSFYAVGDLFYLLCVAFSGITGIFLWFKGNDYAYIFILVYIGTAGMHLFVESQNRYHYHALLMLALLAGISISEIHQMNRAKVLKKKLADNQI